MEKHKINLPKATVQNFGLAMLTVIAEVIVYISVILEGLVEPEMMNGSPIFFIFSIVNAICCFFIVKRKPITIFFVPLIINAFLLVMSFFNTDFWIDPWWAPVLVGWIFCVMASIIGALVRKRSAASDIQLKRA